MLGTNIPLQTHSQSELRPRNPRNLRFNVTSDTLSIELHVCIEFANQSRFWNQEQIVEEDRRLCKVINEAHLTEICDAIFCAESMKLSCTHGGNERIIERDIETVCPKVCK